MIRIVYLVRNVMYIQHDFETKCYVLSMIWGTPHGILKTRAHMLAQDWNEGKISSDSDVFEPNQEAKISEEIRWQLVNNGSDQFSGKKQAARKQRANNIEQKKSDLESSNQSKVDMIYRLWICHHFLCCMQKRSNARVTWWFLAIRWKQQLCKFAANARPIERYIRAHYSVQNDNSKTE